MSDYARILAAKGLRRPGRIKITKADCSKAREWKEDGLKQMDSFDGPRTIIHRKRQEDYGNGQRSV